MITLAEKLLSGSGAEGLEVKGYVEFVSSTPMTISPKYTNSGVTLKYSLNGKSWTTITPNETTPSANIIYFIGQATGTKSLNASATHTNMWKFTGATNLECNGKLDRLIQDTLGDDSDVLTIDNYCFSYMFQNEKSLIKAPELPATTVAYNGYASMFRGCTNLARVPKLPATTLGSHCYNSMFYGCTKITTAPVLPATTLTNFCYSEMFLGCTRLKLSTTKTGIYDTAYRVPASGTGTTASMALNKMFNDTGGTFIGAPEINTTYYTENTPI